MDSGYTAHKSTTILKNHTMSVQKQSAGSLQWDDVRHFLELARLSSLSAAARKLGVEHSTVARRVEALEQALAVRLFDRLPRGWVLTAEGETLAHQARKLEDEALAFARVALGVSSLQGTVRLSAPPAMAAHFLVPRLAARRQDWPGIDLEVMAETREVNLARGEADLALRLSRPSVPGLVVRALGTLGIGLYAAPHYAQRAPEQWEFLGYDESLRQVPHQQWLEGVTAGRRFILRSNDLTALWQAARAGLGVAALPHFICGADAGLVALAAPTQPAPREIWLVMHPDVRRSPRVRAVADMMAALFDAERELLAGGQPWMRHSAAQGLSSGPGPC